MTDPTNKPNGSHQPVDDRPRDPDPLVSQAVLTLLDRINDVYFLVDSEWRFVHFNRRAAEILHMRAEDVLGQTIWEAFPQMLGTLYETYYRKAMATQEVQHFESAAAVSDRWYVTSVYPSPEGLSVVARDISEQKRLMDKLRYSEERYRHVSESGFLALAFFRPDGALTEANDAFLKLTGFTREELEAGELRWDKLTPPEWLPRTLAAMEGYHRTGRIEPYEKEYFRKDGTRFWGLFGGARLADSEEGVAFVLDISAQRETQQIVQTSEARFRHLANAMPQLVWVAETNGRVVYYNQRQQDYDGIAANEDGTWEWSPVVHPEEEAATWTAWNGATLRGEVYQCEHRLKMADGTYRWHLSRGTPVRNTEGEITAWYGTATDIHTQKLIEQELWQLNTALEERVAERTERLREVNTALQQQIVAREEAQAEILELRRMLEEGHEAERLRLAQDLHDLPMQELYAAQYTLSSLMSALGDETLQQSVRMVEESLAHANQMLREISNELRPPALTGFGLLAALRDHVQQFRRRYPVPTVALQASLEELALPMPVQLVFFRIYQQAMHNIVRHAQARQVWIRLAERSDRIVLEIEDDGCGFVVPERWVELARAQHFGLAGSAERAQAVGATYVVESQPGKGTKVRVAISSQLSG